MWSGVSGIDSLGDAQTIIRENWLVPFVLGREFLGSANVEIFVKTDHGFDWDKV